MIVLVSVIRRTASTAVLAAALLTTCVACTHVSADKATSSATVRTEPAPTTTTNPYAVPAVIDAAYVNRVLAGLDAVMGDAIRLVVQTRTIPPEALDRLKAISGNRDVLQLYIDGLQLDMNAGFKNYRPQIGNRQSVATQILAARPDCVFVQLSRDYSAITVDTSAVVNPQWAAIRRLDPSMPNAYNQTSWAFIYDGFTRDRSQPRDPCAG